MTDSVTDYYTEDYNQIDLRAICRCAPGQPRTIKYNRDLF